MVDVELQLPPTLAEKGARFSPETGGGNIIDEFCCLYSSAAQVQRVRSRISQTVTVSMFAKDLWRACVTMLHQWPELESDLIQIPGSESWLAIIQARQGPVPGPLTECASPHAGGLLHKTKISPFCFPHQDGPEEKWLCVSSCRYKAACTYSRHMDLHEDAQTSAPPVLAGRLTTSSNMHVDDSQQGKHCS